MFRPALALLDTKFWGVDKSNVEDQLGALGMLLKIELRLARLDALDQWPDGVERDAISVRRADVLSHATKRAHEHLSPLFDVLVRFWCAACSHGNQLLARAVSFVSALMYPVLSPRTVCTRCSKHGTSCHRRRCTRIASNNRGRPARYVTASSLPRTVSPMTPFGVRAFVLGQTRAVRKAKHGLTRTREC